MRPFLESYNNWKAKAHISEVKTPVLVGICVLVLIVLFLIIQGFWSITQTSGIEITEKSASSHESKTQESLAASPEKAEDEIKEAEVPVIVHVGGAVANPGVYELTQGARLQAAIDAAGGFNENAGKDAVNLARVLSDGEQIIVPTQAEFESGSYQTPQGSTPAPAKVNINTAGIAELTSLSGIGEATAEKIIAEREAHGPFASPEDIMRVSGIGEKKFATIADSICV